MGFIGKESIVLYIQFSPKNEKPQVQTIYWSIILIKGWFSNCLTTSSKIESGISIVQEHDTPNFSFDLLKLYLLIRIFNAVVPS